MGTVTRVDFRDAPAPVSPAERRVQAERLADRVAAAWYSPAGRWVAAALVFAVVGTGLAMLLFAALVIGGRL